MIRLETGLSLGSSLAPLALDVVLERDFPRRKRSRVPRWRCGLVSVLRSILARWRFGLVSGFVSALLLASLLGVPSAQLAAQVPGDDVVLKALDDELQRSMSLRLEDLESPYFIQYSVDDVTSHRLSAKYGALLSSAQSRSRILNSQLRVGSYELDNSNFAGRGGAGGSRGLSGVAELPTDDDYLALRHAVWMATDGLYKNSVAVLAQKRAYLRDRNVSDRSPDFTRAEAPTIALQDRAELAFDRGVWEEYVRRISDQFENYPHIQDAAVTLTASAETRYLLNSEGSRLRNGSTGTSLRVTAEVQAADGERLSDSLSYFAWMPDQLPELSAVLADVQRLADRLGEAGRAPILEEFTGPVLVDGLAAAQLFRQLLARGLAAQASPLGSPRRSGDDLASRLGRRILPVTFQIYDDPRADRFEGTFLAGHYEFDDEGLPPERVTIVVDGRLEAMVTSRAPTADFAKSNGHGRRPGGGVPTSEIGCLYVEVSKGATPEELKQELIDAADSEGLEFGLRVTSLQNRAAGAGAFAGGGRRGGRGGRGGAAGGVVGDPISVYKVYVSDGREEPIRGLEFADLDVRSLRRIVAAGDARTVHNIAGSGVASSVIAPAVLFEELELSRISQEAERAPILAAPHARR
jgi:predicted Zn-dependent protease